MSHSLDRGIAKVGREVLAKAPACGAIPIELILDDPACAGTRSYDGSEGGLPGRYVGFSIGTDYAVEYTYTSRGLLNTLIGPGLSMVR